MGYHFHSILVNKQTWISTQTLKKIIILESSQNFRDIGNYFPKILIGFQNIYLFLNLKWESSSLTKIVEMMPHMLKLAKKLSFPEDFPKLRKFRETSRNDWIFNFRVQNQVPWQKVSGKNTQYIEISQNQPNLGHFRVLGFWDSKVQEIKEVTKSTKNYPIYVTGIISEKKLSKNHPFCYSSYFTM